MRNLLTVLLAACEATMAAGPGTVPAFFIANQGQAPGNLQFLSKGSGLTAYFYRNEAEFRTQTGSLRVQFPGSMPVAVDGLQPLAGKANFLRGGDAESYLDVPLYAAIVYRDLYPGVDLVYRAEGRNLKSEYLVAPGADPGRIRICYSGSSGLRVEPDGSLVITMNEAEFQEQAPVAYQVIDGVRVEVGARFSLAGSDVVEFLLEKYDREAALIIDPVLYSTLLGGAGSDAINAIAVDSTGAAYVAGFTASYDLPTTNPKQNFNAGSNDLFVAKLNPGGNALVYCTYLGGSGDDRAFGIAVDAGGQAAVAGFTASRNFPVTPGALQAKLAGARNAFVLKLNAAGNALIFSTYFGGSGSDAANGVAFDSVGNVYIAGETTSANFPATVLQKTSRGAPDGFLAKLSADGSRIAYATFLGGTYEDRATAVAVDRSGSAYVTGSTYSPDFPLANASQSANAGGQDAFLTRISVDGASLLFSTYLGGSGGSLGYPEGGQALTLDGQGNAYVAGVTSSADFPLLHPFQSSRKGSSDAFVSKFNASGTMLYSTYLGGTGIDSGNAIAVDGAGNAYVAGQTFSKDLPVANAAQQASGGDYDAFTAKLGPGGDTLPFLSYLGGAGSDTATAIALDSSGDVYVAGWTLSPNFPIVAGYQTVNAGSYGGFVAKIAAGAPPSVGGISPNSGSAESQTFTVQFSDPFGAADLTGVSVLFNSSTATTSACSLTYNKAANMLALMTDAGTAPGSGITPGSGAQQNSQCILNGVSSRVSIAGNVLTLNLAIVFQPAFAGVKTIYLQAASPYGATGWQTAGSWTVPTGAGSPVSVVPSSGSGGSQTFTFLFTDPKGYAAISSASVTINATLAAAGSCYLYYSRAANTIYLASDAGTSWLTPVVLGQAGTLQNSQCAVNTTSSSAAGSGNNLTLTLALSFQSSFAGAKNIYMEVYDGKDSGSIIKGAWTVTASVLGPISVTPSSGTGLSQMFTFVFSDPKGYASIISSSITIGATASVTGSCYIYYGRAANTVKLANDAGNAWLTPVVLGQSVTLQNSQCAVNAAASSFTVSGTILTLSLSITFQPGFTGSKNIYMEVYDGQDSGSILKGTWTPDTVTMGPVSVNPSSGSGAGQMFNFAYAEPKGYAAISSASININTTLAASGSCYLYYLRATNALYLANDSGTAWLTPVFLGQAGTLQNSQCSVNTAASSATGNGTILTLNLSLAFQSAFKGTKNVYMELYDGQDSGFKQKGTWTIP